MKTIVLGFDNEKGLGSGKILKGPEVPYADQSKLIQNAKRNNEYPEGIVRLGLFTVEEVEVAIKTKPATESKPKTQTKK